MTTSATSVDILTEDVEHARLAVTESFSPHRLEPLQWQTFKCRFTHRMVGEVGVSHLGYGAPVRIEPGDIGWFYIVAMPASGSALFRMGRQEVVTGGDSAAVVSPGEALSMTWGQDNAHDCFYVTRSSVETHLTRLLGRRPRRPLLFRAGMNTAGPAGRTWMRAVRAFAADVADRSPLLDDERVTIAWEQMLVTALLLHQPHNYADELHTGAPATGRAVRRATTLIDDHFAEPLTVLDLAEAVGTSVRALQEAFRRDLGTTPIAYLRDRRCDEARKLLESADPQALSVTQVATACGFTHLGRFAVAYRERFGESPSATLHTDRPQPGA